MKRLLFLMLIFMLVLTGCHKEQVTNIDFNDINVNEIPDIPQTMHVPIDEYTVQVSPTRFVYSTMPVNILDSDNSYKPCEDALNYSVDNMSLFFKLGKENITIKYNNSYDTSKLSINLSTLPSYVKFDVQRKMCGYYYTQNFTNKIVSMKSISYTFPDDAKFEDNKVKKGNLTIDFTDAVIKQNISISTVGKVMTFTGDNIVNLDPQVQLTQAAATQAAVDSSDPTHTYGWGTLGNSGSYIKRNLINWSLAPIQNTVVTNATFYSAHDLRGASTTSWFIRVLSTWDTSVTWNTQPSISGTDLYGLYLTESNDSTYYGINVTKDIKNWMNGSWVNYGWMIKTDEITTDYIYTDGGINNVYYITVDYLLPVTINSPTPAAGTYLNSSYILNVSTDIGYNNTIYYNVNGGSNIVLCRNCSWVNSTVNTQNYTTGNTTLYVYANNSAGEIVGTTRSFNYYNGSLISTSVTLCGNYTTTDLFIVNNSVITICHWLTNTSSNGLNGTLQIYANNVYMSSGTSINGLGKGYNGSKSPSVPGYGPGGGDSTLVGSTGAGGGGYGGVGGKGYAGGGNGGHHYNFIDNNITMGSGGGCAAYDTYIGGDGGALVIINATSVVSLNGSISVSGTYPTVGSTSGGAGGGSGGGIYINANVINGNPILNASGGNGWAVTIGGSGAGGRIYIKTNTNNSFVPIIYTNAGSIGYNVGGAGTYVYEEPTNKILTINNQFNSVAETPIYNATLNTTYVTGGSRPYFGNDTINNLLKIDNTVIDATIAPSAYFYAYNMTLNTTMYINATANFSYATLFTKGVYYFNNLERVKVYNDLIVWGNMTHLPGTTVLMGAINVEGGNITLMPSSIINVDYKGYLGSSSETIPGSGPGGGASLATMGTGAGGAGYAAFGGLGSSPGGAGGTYYGNLTNVYNYGSGGGCSFTPSYTGGNGGGLIVLNASNNLNITGAISAIGQPATVGSTSGGGGGGSGGSIWLIGNNVYINNTLNVAGNKGYSASLGGAGSGGRIFVQYANAYISTERLNLSSGQVGYQLSGSGTYYALNTSSNKGKLIIDNLNIVAATSTMIINETIDTIIISNKSRVNMTGNTVTGNLNEISTAGILTFESTTNTINNMTLNGTTIFIGNALNILDTFIVGNLATFEFGNNNVVNVSNLNVYGRMFVTGGFISTVFSSIQLVSNKITVYSSGVINATGGGYKGANASESSGFGPGNGTSNTAITGRGGGGAGYSAIGGNGISSTNAGIIYGDANSIYPGSGGGYSYYTTAYGGHGGGIINISSSSFIINNGQILANGQDGTKYSTSYTGGGGSGGTIFIISTNISNTGTISVIGGNSTTTSYMGGCGSAGRIILNYTNLFNNTGTISAYSGSLCAQRSGAGTKLYQNSTYSYLELDNSNINGTRTNVYTNHSYLLLKNMADLNLGNNTITILNISAGADEVYVLSPFISDYVYLNDSLFTSSNMTVNHDFFIYTSGVLQSNSLDTMYADNYYVYGTIQHNLAATTFTSANILTGSNFYLYTGSLINNSKRGYLGSTGSALPGYGPGGGASATLTSRGGGGGGYGGTGGNGRTSWNGGPTYGNATNVTSPGSGGGYSYQTAARGGNGGGYLKINLTGTFSNNGTINCSGENGVLYSTTYTGGGGSGGGVFIVANTLSGNGKIDVCGGGSPTSTTRGGGGGGGRLYVIGNLNNSFIPTICSLGGVGYNVTSTGNATVNITLLGGVTDTNFTMWNGSILQDAYTDYMTFRCFTTQQQCEPNNQNTTTSRSIYQVCNNGTGIGTYVKFYMSATCSNINLKCDDDYTYADSITVSTTPQNIHNAIAISECINVSCWADYNNPQSGCYFDTYANVTAG